MNVGELFVHLGVKADTYSVKDFARAIGNLPLSVAGAIASLTGMELGFMALTSHTIDLANNLNIFRAETGLSTQELQRWQHAATQAGISGDSVTQSLTGIANAIVQITRFGNAGPAIAFGRLGISNWATKDPFQILTEMRSRYAKMNPNEFRAYSGQLGVSPEMMRLFELSPGQFKNYMGSGSTLSESDLRGMADFQKELAHFTIVVEQSFVPVLRELTPYMGEIASTLGELVKSTGHGAIGTFKWMDEHDPAKLGADQRAKFDQTLDDLKWSFDQLLSRQANVTVTQHITGVTSDQDAHRAGAEHLKHELTRAAKQMSKGH